jgi:4-hydroxyphenylpyruvate dioxygenase-like putative hemolysin
MPPSTQREAISDLANPLGLDGIEFVEYATSRPQALGQVLEMMGFSPWRATARARCCCTGRAMNVIVNAHVGARARHHRHAGDRRRRAARARRGAAYRQRSSAAPGRCPRTSR